jgi:tetratricopeptide (TPR) repeat protein
LESFRKELRSNKGFQWQAWVQAANFAVANNTNLEEALQWSNYAINGQFIGQKNFTTLSTKAAVLQKLGKADEAKALMKEAMPLANMLELHNYARQLITEKRVSEALDAFKLNAEKNPNTFTTNMGLARGYSANGDYKAASKYAKLALAQAPNKQNKDAVDGYLKMLAEGKDIN